VKIRVLYFARLREALGTGREEIELPASVATLGELRAWMIGRGDPWAKAFSTIRPLRAALAQKVCDDDARLREGAEVAFFPPVTGG